MKTNTIVAGAVCLLASAVPGVAAAQDLGRHDESRTYVPWVNPSTQGYTEVHLAPPPWSSIYLYEGRRLLARLDGPGSLWLPTGRSYRVTAQQGDQTIWSAPLQTRGAPIDIEWPAAASSRWPTSPACAAPRVPQWQMRAILGALDAQRDEAARLDVLRSAAKRWSFSESQRALLAGRLRSDAYRSAAYQALAPCPGGREEPSRPPVELDRKRTPLP